MEPKAHRETETGCHLCASAWLILLPLWRAAGHCQPAAYEMSTRHSTSKVDWFYGTSAWEKCSKDYLRSVGGICERCAARGEVTPAEIVHHKIHLTPDNVHDPSISLSWDNLMAVCRACHAEMHGRNPEGRRWKVSPDGKVVSLGNRK